jgi:hypothetical protein
MRKLALTAVLLAFALAATAARRHDATSAERFSAFAVSLGGPRTPSGTAQVDITIDHWSTDQARQQLLGALKKGQDSLLDTLRDLEPVGSIHTPGSLAYDLRYAHQMPGEDGGRRIVIATDRPIRFWEAANRPRSFDYPFMFIELRMNGEGQGEGKLSLATKVTSSSDGKFVELENYGAQPVMLNQVKSVR